MSILPVFDLRRAPTQLSMDQEQLGEFAYDYIWLQQEVEQPGAVAVNNQRNIAMQLCSGS